jgi:hypothetical protein
MRAALTGGQPGEAAGLGDLGLFNREAKFAVNSLYFEPAKSSDNLPIDFASSQTADGHPDQPCERQPLISG